MWRLSRRWAAPPKSAIGSSGKASRPARDDKDRDDPVQTRAMDEKMRHEISLFSRVLPLLLRLPSHCATGVVW
jgi:hypothetical protein